jgi:hypothetical protein
MTKLKFKVGDQCHIVNDWLPAEAKAKVVIIFKLHENGWSTRVTFAEIRWSGRGSAEMTEQYGVIFPLDELRKVDKKT